MENNVKYLLLKSLRIRQNSCSAIASEKIDMHYYGKTILDTDDLNETLNSLKAIRNAAARASSRICCDNVLHSRIYGSYVRFSVGEKDEKGKWHERYISRKDKRFKHLAQKRYYEGLIKQLDRCTESVEKLIADESFSSLEKYIESGTGMFLSELPAPFNSTRQNADAWANMKYCDGMDYFSDSLVYQTKKGDKVRSKSELIIANMLFDMDIPYRYECLLELRGGKEFYPDFTIMLPDSGKLVYFEYFGLMDDPEYAADAINKIGKYAAAGICFGDNFLAAFESSKTPLDPDSVRLMFESLLHKK